MIKILSVSSRKSVTHNHDLLKNNFIFKTYIIKTNVSNIFAVPVQNNNV